MTLSQSCPLPSSLIVDELHNENLLGVQKKNVFMSTKEGVRSCFAIFLSTALVNMSDHTQASHFNFEDLLQTMQWLGSRVDWGKKHIFLERNMYTFSF